MNASTHQRKPAAIRRLEIADAALELIGERGVGGLTAAALAERVGLTAGALYRHFESLEAILGAAVARALEHLEATFPPMALPPEVRLRRLAEARIALFSEHPAIAWLLLSDQVGVTVPPESVVELKALAKRSRTYLLDAMRSGAKTGTLRSDISPEALLIVFTGTIHALAGHVGARRAGSDPKAPSVRGSAKAPDVLAALFLLLSPTTSTATSVDDGSPAPAGEPGNPESTTGATR